MSKPNQPGEFYSDLLKILRSRFGKNLNRHPNIEWIDVEAALLKNPRKLETLQKMENTGGEPDVIGRNDDGRFIFCDCAAETPKGRRSICYDQQAQISRKEHPPANNAIDMAEKIGIELLNEQQYRHLQTLGHFDAKTSSWIKTPDDIRALGGALFGDYRYGNVFIYHNGAQSYYASRGFRGLLLV